MEVTLRAPSLPLPLLVAGLLLNLVLVFWFFRSKFLLCEAFLVLAISARLQSNLFHQYTLSSVLPGISVNALITMLFTLSGMVLFRWASLTRLRPLGLENFISFTWATTLLSGNVGALGDYIPRTIYLLVLTSAFFLLCTTKGRDRFVNLVLVCLAPLLAMQLLSLALGHAKATELDGSLAYIGGYVHEAAFSSVGLFALVVALFTDNSRKALMIVVFAMISLALGSYRTAMIGAVPILFCFYLRFERRVFQSFAAKGLVKIFVVFFLVNVVLVVANDQGGRFNDIGVLLTEPSRFIKLPWEFSTLDRQIMSGRLLLWSRYLYSFMGGDGYGIFFGNGADSWKLEFEKYAHNVYVSYVYEFGLIGLIFYIAILSFQIILGFMSGSRERAARSPWALMSVLLYGFGTIPLGNIEGIFLMAATQTLYQIERRQKLDARSALAGSSEQITTMKETGLAHAAS